MQTDPIKTVGIPGKGVECTFKCFLCGEYFTMLVTFEEYGKRFFLDTKIQDAMPQRDPEFRERFMNSYCPECYKMMYVDGHCHKQKQQHDTMPGM
jgi:hypothetical protein